MAVKARSEFLGTERVNNPQQETRNMNRIRVSFSMVLCSVLCAVSLSCASTNQNPNTQPDAPKPPNAISQMWTVVWPHLQAAIPDLLALLLSGGSGSGANLSIPSFKASQALDEMERQQQGPPQQGRQADSEEESP